MRMKPWIYLAACALLVANIGCGGSTSEKQETVSTDPSSEADMYTAAQNAENEGRPRDAIGLYRKILKEYPESGHSYKAQFLVGFVFSEEMNEPDSARVAFETVLEKYPDSEFADDAQAMLAFIDGEMPSFQDAPPQ